VFFILDLMLVNLHKSSRGEVVFLCNRFYKARLSLWSLSVTALAVIFAFTVSASEPMQANSYDGDAFYRLMAFEFGGARVVSEVTDTLSNGEVGNSTDRLLPYAKGGHVPSQALLGLIYGRLLKDPDNAFLWYIKAAEAGDIDSSFMVGESYFNALGVSHNYPEAYKWSMVAARGGAIKAQFAVALMLEYGLGVGADIDKAIEWYERAAMANHDGAANALGLIYARGEGGLSRDYSLSVYWFNRSAKRGHIGSQYSLGMMYGIGAGTEKDYIKAAKWLNKAAKAGDVDSMSVMSCLYGSGIGVEKNNELSQLLAQQALSLKAYAGESVVHDMCGGSGDCHVSDKEECFVK